ncbi:MAG: hypothetical protein P0S96_03155 [Simkaniaceae bacterium]|nr:hypothetical protein [Candidatus Sacchlamyda saccharinae]
MAATLTVRKGDYGPEFFDDLFKVDVSSSAKSEKLLAPEDFPKPYQDDKAGKKYAVGGDKLETIKRVKIDTVLNRALENAKDFRRKVKESDQTRYGMLLGELNGYRMLLIRIDALAVSFFAHIASFENPRLGDGQEVVLKEKDTLKDKDHYKQRMRELLAGKNQLIKLIDKKPRIGKSSAASMLAKKIEALAS